MQIIHQGVVMHCMQTLGVDFDDSRLACRRAKGEGKILVAFLHLFQGFHI